MITYETIKPHIYQITYDLPYTTEEIVNELKHFPWDGWGDAEARRSVPSRSFCGSEKVMNNRILGEIATYFYEPHLYAKDMMQKLYSEPNFETVWRFSESELLSHVRQTVAVYRDAPGFNMSIHVDNRRLVTSGLMTFVDRDDPRISTWFYDTEDGKNPVRSKNGPNKAWTAATLHNTWHNASNNTNDYRYSLYFGLSLAL